MIILSNGLTRKADEGAVKIASSLIRRIKISAPETTVVTYERTAPESDVHLSLNKLFLNGSLVRLIRRKREPVLYVPFPTRMLPAAIRIFILSWSARWGLRTLLVMCGEMDALSKMLLKASRSEILTVSRENWDAFRTVIGDRAKYLKTGVDVQKFSPVTGEQKVSLREKYGIPPGKNVVLHVGHLKEGRNIGCLLDLGEKWHVVLAVSTLTASERDAMLRQRFLEKSNVTLLEDYVPQIEELYQLADVYLFPVTDMGNCIDVPLSVLEAAACGIPVAATPYGELKELLDKPGFYPIETFEPALLDALLEKAVQEGTSPRSGVLDYDWENTVKDLLM